MRIELFQNKKCFFFSLIGSSKLENWYRQYLLAYACCFLQAQHEYCVYLRVKAALR